LEKRQNPTYHNLLLRAADRTRITLACCVHARRLARMEIKMRALPVALLLLCSCLPTRAQEQKMEMGRGVICGTLDQVKRFIALRSDGKEQDSALLVVNGESSQAGHTGACNLGLVMFDNPEPIGEMVLNGTPVTIVKIKVHAIGNGYGWKEVPDIERFTAVPQKGRIA
jgi:hypothetical protein